MPDFDTLAARGACDEAPYGAETMPIFQTTTFTGGEFSYSRISNPTRAYLQRRLAELEGGSHAFAFSSGLAAVSALFSMLKSGDRAVVSRDCYGGIFRMATRIYAKYGIEFEFVDTSDPRELEAAMSKKARLLLVETPSNPLNKVSPIGFAASLAHSAGACFAVDNTFLTPYFQRPLSLGADIVIHSATKFLCGHHDTLAGVAVTKDEGLAAHFSLMQGTLGNVLSPFDCFLISRGLQTLHIRMERHRENALAAAEYLASHPAVERVMYPELEGSPHRATLMKQASGGGGVVSFVTREDVFDRIPKLGLIRKAESLGGCQTLLTHPMTQTHASLPAYEKQRLGITPRLFRLSLGLESKKDILEDLEIFLG